ncbi:polysaccharide deacetylase family protein [Glaciecola petra]|uniref:Polysaccharide deacetylase family protein n=1 Tax=Glaciecola petra TaxID=3075602 RepID=A0ABU2ZR82_9ALTE|nr:polysaccharide deacetylase family protein [Aestuariibacter sp. P117]MDT0595140.1 polysaccharide deacetylase family protein [Aestuariibacter sp. P117]
MARVLLLYFIMLVNSVLADASENRDAIIPINERNFVILQYHHVATNTPSITSISPSVFSEHMRYLKEHHQVIDLDTALSKLKNKQPLPDKSVVITFDDGYKNIFENATPILEKYDFPYTVFINPDEIGNSNAQMTWQDIKSMMPLATFANHTLDHLHLLERLAGESESAWLIRVMDNINRAENAIRKQLSYSKKWLAYPFGEFNQDLRLRLQQQGYIGFGQQSGAVSNFSDTGALPRFPAAGIYANIKTLKTKLNSLAMPVIAQNPKRVEYMPKESIKSLSLTIEDHDLNMANFACYFKGESIAIERSNNSVNARLNHLTAPGRQRINCTAPSLSQKGRFYWYSYPIFTSTQDGKFLD